MARDSSIDALRGLAIVLVVAGHAIVLSAVVHQGGPGFVHLDSNNWIPLASATNPFLSVFYSFHMPLFAFVSGLVMWPPKNTPLGKRILGRARGLIVPYIAWFAILFVIAQRSLSSASAGFGPALLGAVVGQGGLWYLYSLFLCSVVVMCVAQLPGWRLILAASAAVAAVLLTEKLFPLPGVLYLSDTLWIYPFVVLGYLVGSIKQQVLRFRWPISVVGLLALGPLLWLRYPAHVSSLQPINRLAIAMNSAGVRGGFVLSLLLPFVCASAAIMALFALYAGRGGWAIDVQAWFGRKSLGIYATHGVLILWMVAAGIRNALVLTVLALGASALVTMGLERIPMVDTILLGRRGAPGPGQPNPADLTSGSSPDTNDARSPRS